MKHPVWPDFITNMPEAEVPFKDVTIWVLQGEKNQIVFTDNRITGDAHEHSHGAQWGIVVEGDMELTINGVPKIYRKGDSYFIPEGAPHSGKFKTHVCTIDVFADRDRYKLKKK